MTSRRSDMQEDVRYRILRLLQDDPEMSQRDLAAEVGVSTGRAHYVLKALIEKGLVKIENFSAAEDKRRYAYILTRKGLSEKAAMTARFLQRKTEEFEALKAEIDALRAETDDAGGAFATSGQNGQKTSKADGGRRMGGAPRGS